MHALNLLHPSASFPEAVNPQGPKPIRYPAVCYVYLLIKPVEKEKLWTPQNIEVTPPRCQTEKTAVKIQSDLTNEAIAWRTA
jgi:hypothetical protein